MWKSFVCLLAHNHTTVINAAADDAIATTTYKSIINTTRYIKLVHYLDYPLFLSNIRVDSLLKVTYYFEELPSCCLIRGNVSFKPLQRTYKRRMLNSTQGTV